MPTKIAVVTGSNKGIGFEIAKKLCENGIKTILACRDPILGKSAADQLQSVGYDAEFRPCDISSKSSVDNFVTNLQNDYDCIDILVNNAAIAFKAADPTPFAEQAAPTISVNYFGTLYITQNLLPLIKKSNTPRIVNIASLAGHLGILKSPERVKHFANPQLTIEELGNLMNEFINDVQTGQHASKGWPNSCYGVSKLGVIALTKILARTEPDIIVNACCPGYCKTDMSSHRGIRSAEEGARTPAYLALLPSSLDCPTGLFFKDEAPVEW